MFNVDTGKMRAYGYTKETIISYFEDMCLNMFKMKRPARIPSRVAQDLGVDRFNLKSVSSRQSFWGDSSSKRPTFSSSRSESDWKSSRGESRGESDWKRSRSESRGESDWKSSRSESRGESDWKSSRGESDWKRSSSSPRFQSR